MPPRIVTARSMGLQFRVAQLSRMGPETSVVGHYSGDTNASGARAKDWVAGVRKAKAFHRDHQVNRGWAGIGYHYLIPDDGSIICCRSTFHTGAHVLRNNRGRIGVNMPATVGHRPTRRQAQAFHWLLHNAHTAAMPREHRTDRDLSRVPRFGHKDLMNTSCPGLFHGMYLRGGEPWVELPLDAPADDEGFFELSSEDELVLAEISAGKLPDLAADSVFFGPDDEEVEALAEGSDRLELPEADDEFEEDLTDLVAEVDAELDEALTPR
jgi:N-acetylmuramoyl-L-alanine amidase